MEGQNGCIHTFTGKRFNPFQPRIKDIDIADIAHGLALTTRFSGMTVEPYSVAQHSVLCAELVGRNLREGNGLPAALVSGNEYLISRYQFDALMHDASEAYLGDVPSPIKHGPEFQGYRRAEDRLMELISARYGNRWPVSSITRSADEVMLHTEARDLFKNDSSVAWADPSKADAETIVPWNWKTSERMFMRAFNLLVRGKGDEL